MKVRAWTSALALGAALFGFSTLGQAQDWMGAGSHENGRAPHTMPFSHMDKIAKRIGLTQEQQTQLKALHEKQQAAMRSQREQNHKLQEERSAAWAAPTLDAARLEALRQQEMKLMDNMSRMRLEHQLAVAKILTPQQRQQMASWKKQRRAPRAGMQPHQP